MRILIIGGNRFFGKKLTKLLIESNHEVTLLNRQSLDDGFGDTIKRIKCDRLDKEQMSKALENTYWDVVFDQVCYDYDTAKDACDIFKGKVHHYIHTSSQSVYDAGANINEDSFIPKSHTFDHKADKNSDYSEAKRQAETAFERYASFATTYMRFPIVIGDDDYTERFKFHIDRIINEKEIYFKSLDAHISFISSDDAAKSLKHMAENKVNGPINCCNSGSIKIGDFVKIIEKATNKSFIPAPERTDENFSPYAIDQDWFMSHNKLETAGLVLPNVSDTIEKIISLTK